MLFEDAPILLPDAELRLIPDWCPPPRAARWLAQLLAETPGSNRSSVCTAATTRCRAWSIGTAIPRPSIPIPA